LIVIGELVDRARAAGVQAMVEGPGHVPIHQIESNVLVEKTLCKGAPFYVLGPLVTDVSPGYDHISAAIGGAIAAAHGADFLCYVTPTEHLSLPGVEEVREGVIALRIAAHAADIAKGVKSAGDWDRRLSTLRKKLDWDGMIRLSIDPERARTLREKSPSKSTRVCSMCGEYCVIKDLEELFQS
jgi:phosphomethylpyrimidine synthase